MPSRFNNEIVNESIIVMIEQLDTLFELDEDAKFCFDYVFQNQNPTQVLSAALEKGPDNECLININNILRFSRGDFDIFNHIIDSDEDHYRSAITNSFLKSLSELEKDPQSLQKKAEFNNLQQDFKDYFAKEYSRLIYEKTKCKFFAPEVSLEQDPVAEIDGHPVDSHHGTINVSLLHDESVQDQVPSPEVAANDFRPLANRPKQQDNEFGHEDGMAVGFG
mgnify:CR=1 FL=1|tara:strand:+ start:2321 stop:2983 length:663 start_codon:yes stop_codon:yes gene_type:complete